MVEITLEGPKKNALSTDLMARLRASLGAARGAPVLLTGRGDAFSAGLDLTEVAGLDHEGMTRFVRAIDACFHELYTYPGPVVAAINGHAIASGCVLALCSDHRILARRSEIRMGLNEVALGLQFPPATLRICRSRLSPAHEAEVLLGADLFDPDAALRTGIVDELAEDPVARGRERLAILARHPPDAYAACKAALRTASTASPGDGERFAALLPAWTAPELKARIEALLQRSRARPG